jgi:hypothetical protein
MSWTVSGAHGYKRLAWFARSDPGRGPEHCRADGKPGHGTRGPLRTPARRGGEVEATEAGPDVYLRSFNFSHLPEAERARWYRETPRSDGSTLREYEIFAVDREIEIAPG